MKSTTNGSMKSEMKRSYSFTEDEKFSLVPWACILESIGRKKTETALERLDMSREVSLEEIKIFIKGMNPLGFRKSLEEEMSGKK